MRFSKHGTQRVVKSHPCQDLLGKPLNLHRNRVGVCSFLLAASPVDQGLRQHKSPESGGNRVGFARPTAVIEILQWADMGGCQNYGPFIVRHLIFRVPKKGQ